MGVETELRHTSPERIAVCCGKIDKIRTALPLSDHPISRMLRGAWGSFVFAALEALVALRINIRAADADHPYGDL